MNSGIYKIRNLINNKVYIGSAATTFKARWHHHKIDLRNNKHHSIYLQRSWLKYGEDKFVFEILEEVISIREIILNREQYWLDYYKSYEREYGYNISKIAGSIMLGRYHTEETKQKIRNKRAKQIITKESKCKISKTRFERKYVGENAGNVKLTWIQVREIREKYKGVYTQKQLREEYNVSKSCIRDILRNKTWKEENR